MSSTKQAFDVLVPATASLTPEEDHWARRLSFVLRNRELAQRRLVVKSGTRMVVLRRDKIEWVAGEREYVRLHLGGDSYLVRQTMNAMESALCGTNFIRVHRSTIVNLDYVREMKPTDCGDYEITMRDGMKLKLSRNHRGRLQELLQDSFSSERAQYQDESRSS